MFVSEELSEINGKRGIKEGTSMENASWRYRELQDKGDVTKQRKAKKSKAKGV